MPIETTTSLYSSGSGPRNKSWRCVTSSTGLHVGAPCGEHHDMTVSEKMDQVVNVRVPQEEEEHSSGLMVELIGTKEH